MALHTWITIAAFNQWDRVLAGPVDICRFRFAKWIYSLFTDFDPLQIRISVCDYCFLDVAGVFNPKRPMKNEGEVMLGSHSGVKRFCLAIIVLPLSFLMAGCPSSSSSSSSSTTTTTTTTPPVGMITGQWQVTETAKTANNSLCQPPADPLSAPYSLWFTQSGGTVTALDASKNAFTSGTLNGSALSYTGSYPDGAGTTTLQPMAATIASTCNSATGTATWSYTEPGGFTCAGTTQFTATRTVGSGCSAVTTNSAAADTEPNDTPSTVQAVVRPVEITGGIAATDTVASRTDLYSFTLAASTPVTIMLRRTSGITDIDLRLQTGAGATITTSASSSGNEVISQTLAAGSYMVMISPFGTVVGTSTYSLVIQ